MDDLMKYYRDEWKRCAIHASESHADLDRKWRDAQLAFAILAVTICAVSLTLGFALGWIYFVYGPGVAPVCLWGVWSFGKDRKESSKRWLEYRDYDLQMADKFSKYIHD